jgi:drug/metabolite transporter (DMT)-like permease
VSRRGSFYARRLVGPVAMLVAAALFWGLATALSKVALEQLMPVDLLGVEVTTGAVVIAALAVARGARPGRPQPTLLLLGVLEPGLTFLLFDVGLNRTAATHAALLLATEALFVVTLAALLLGERFHRSVGPALAAATVGSALLAWQSGGTQASVTGDVLVLAASLIAAVYSVLARRVAPGRDPVRVTAVQMIGGLLIAAPIALTYVISGHSNLGRANAGHVMVAMGVGLLSSVFPFLLFTIAISRVTATIASLIITLDAVFGTAASILLLGETIGTLQIVGGAMVILAAAAASVAEPTPS